MYTMVYYFHSLMKKNEMQNQKKLDDKNDELQRVKDDLKVNKDLITEKDRQMQGMY